MKQGHQILTAVQCDGSPHRDCAQPEKSGIVLLPDRVFIGDIVKQRLQFPQVKRGRDGVEKISLRFQNPEKFLGGQGGEDIGQQVGAPVRQWKVVGGGNGKLPLFQALCRPFQSKFGDINPRGLGGMPRLRQRPEQAFGIIALATAAVNQDGGCSGSQKLCRLALQRG